jgi:hypothetical protein
VALTAYAEKFERQTYLDAGFTDYQLKQAGIQPLLRLVQRFLPGVAETVPAPVPDAPAEPAPAEPAVPAESPAPETAPETAPDSAPASASAAPPESPVPPDAPGEDRPASI